MFQEFDSVLVCIFKYNYVNIFKSKYLVLICNLSLFQYILGIKNVTVELDPNTVECDMVEVETCPPVQ